MHTILATKLIIMITFLVVTINSNVQINLLLSLRHCHSCYYNINVQQRAADTFKRINHRARTRVFYLFIRRRSWVARLRSGVAALGWRVGLLFNWIWWRLFGHLVTVEYNTVQLTRQLRQRSGTSIMHRRFLVGSAGRLLCWHTQSRNIQLIFNSWPRTADLKLPNICCCTSIANEQRESLTISEMITTCGYLYSSTNTIAKIFCV